MSTISCKFLSLVVISIHVTVHVLSFPGEHIYGCVNTDSRGKIHLSFDDGPSGVNNNGTDNVLNLLQKYNITATFFVNTRKILRDPTGILDQRLQRMIDDGHTVASHTASHSNLLINPNWKQDIDNATVFLSDKLGYKPRLFRPPFGGVNVEITEYLRDNGFTIVMWNLGNMDWYTKAILNNVREQNQYIMATMPGEGGIITLHDQQYSTDDDIKSLEELIWVLTNTTHQHNFTVPYFYPTRYNFRIVNILDCLERTDIDDIPYNYAYINNDNSTNTLQTWHWIVYIGSSLLCGIIGFIVGYYFCLKNKSTKDDEQQLITLVSNKYV